MCIRDRFTIRVGPQRITFMIGAEPQLAFIKAKDELLDQVCATLSFSYY